MSGLGAEELDGYMYLALAPTRYPYLRAAKGMGAALGRLVALGRGLPSRSLVFPGSG